MKKSTFCVLPWLHLATHPHGIVSLCCESSYKGGENMARNAPGTKDEQFLDLGKDSVNSFMESDYYKTVRLQMLDKKVPKACQICFEKEARGIESKRLYENNNYSYFTEEDALRVTEKNGSIEPKLAFVELRLGNACNVKCRSCNPYSSTKWFSDYSKLSSALDFVEGFREVIDFNWPDSEKFWDELSNHSETLRTIYINGGEPTLIKKHWNFLRGLVESGASKNIRLEYSINMTLIPDIALPLWEQFKEVEIRASIDDLEGRNQYIRHPTSWQSVLKSLDKLKDQSVKVVILQTVSAMNFYYLDDFVQWVGERGLMWTHNYVTDPAYLSPKALPLVVRKKILEKLSKSIPEGVFVQLENFFGSGEDLHLWDQFKNYTKVVDNLRSEEFEKVFPDFTDLLRESGFPFSK